MEGDGSNHRQRALESLTRAKTRPRSSLRVSRDIRDTGHSIWSDDAMSTRHIAVSGSFESRFKPVNLEQNPLPTPVPAMPTPHFMGPPEPAHNGVEILWSYSDPRRDSHHSMQNPVLEEESRIAKMSRMSKIILSKPFTFWEKLKGKGKERVGWRASVKAIVKFSWLNVLLIFVPIAWAVNFSPTSHVVKFILCFIAIIPLSKLLDFGGEQLALYCGRVVGDLIVITLNNAVETALALVLLSKCELKLLQSTIAGVVLLRLLLVPGSAFLTGGARVLTQELHPHVVQLNNTLLTAGALTLLLPAIFFAALDRIVPAGTQGVAAAVSDSVRGDLLKLSRALAIFLLVIYVCSRFYLHNPPGDTDSLHDHPNAPTGFKADVARLEEEDPVLNPWVCIIMLTVTVILVGFTTEFLVHNVHPMRRVLGLREEWFGLILLPLVSYSADGILSTVYFIRHYFQRYFGTPAHISTLAQGRSIDLGIQFLIFWMPLLVMFGWFSHKPMSLLFDVFEVAVLLGACFLVNYVTADAKTNWAEGMTMVTFYLMIAITAWFYPGQSDVRYMLACSTVEVAVATPENFAVAFPTQSNQHAIQETLAPTEAADEVLNRRLLRLLDLHRVLPVPMES